MVKELKLFNVQPFKKATYPIIEIGHVMKSLIYGKKKKRFCHAIKFYTLSSVFGNYLVFSNFEDWYK